MNSKTRFLSIITLAAALMAVAAPAPAQEATPVALKASTMTIKGTSTMHPWESTVQKVTVTGTARLDGTTPTFNGLKVDVLVTDIVSEHSMMDKLTRKALGSEKHPDIVFALDSLKSTGVGAAHATGTLTINGETRPYEMDVALQQAADGTLDVSGDPEIDMTQWSVKPPSLMLGAIKVGPVVHVPFQVTLSLSTSR